MKFNYKKIASVASSVLMVGSTVALAAAANFPAPFKNDGYAIVYGGANAASTDLASAIDIAASLSSASSTSSSSTSTVSGEAYALFTSSSPLYIGDTLNSVRSAVTDTELPTLLADGDFSGNVEADFVQTIHLNSHPNITFAKQPTSDDDPTVGLALGTTAANHIYNMSVIFNQAVNFTHADSEGETLDMFGSRFTIGSATDNDELVLFQSSQTVFLSSETNPSQQVTVETETYTVELVAASDTSATVKLTDSTGRSDQKEIDENTSKKILGVEVGVNNADENNFRLTAEVSVGAQKVILQHGSAVKVGADEDTVDGTQVSFVDTTYPGNLTQLRIQIAATDGDLDALVPGSSFEDPVFGTFKLDFNGLNIPEDSSDRDTIRFTNAGNDKLKIEFTNHKGHTKNLEFMNNVSSAVLADSDKDDVYNVVEMSQANRSEYVFVGHEDEGYLLEVKTVDNSSSGFDNDEVIFQDVFSTDNYEVSITSEGSGTVVIGGKTYTVSYFGASTLDSDARWVRVNSPDSGGNNVILFPSMETSKGAKVSFHESVSLNLGDWDGAGSDVTGLLFPDGDGYTSVTVATGGNPSVWNFTDGSTVKALNLSITGNSIQVSVGTVTYNITTGSTTAGNNLTNVMLEAVGSSAISNPAVLVFEEQDDDTNNYDALIAKLDFGGTSDDGVGIDDIETTWGSDAVFDELQREDNEDLYDSMDRWGTIVRTDRSESDQYTATVYYPDEQVQALIYAAASDASITGGSSGGSTSAGSVSVKDSEIQQVATKNLIVVGGSCVNSVAATLLGSTSPLCGSAFEAATTVGSGSFLIQTFASPYSASKIATLVAGYNAADTTNAATYLRTQTVDTTVGKKYIGTSATQATLQTSTA